MYYNNEKKPPLFINRSLDGLTIVFDGVMYPVVFSVVFFLSSSTCVFTKMYAKIIGNTFKKKLFTSYACRVSAGVPIISK